MEKRDGQGISLCITGSGPCMKNIAASGGSPSIIVLGAGIAGLAAADRLASMGYHVTIIEQRDAAGGTHRSRHIGPYTFDVGSIFYEEDAKIFDLAPGIRDLCPEVLSIQRRIAPDGSLLLYPIEPRDFLRQSCARLGSSALDLLVSRASLKRDGTLETLCRKRLGRRFFDDSGLRNYITRFHHASPSDIDEEFFFRRMAIIERFTRMRSLVRNAAQTLVSGKASQARKQWPMRVRPRSGFQPVFSAIVDRLSASGIEFAFGEKVASITREGTDFRVRTDRTMRRGAAVLSTIPIDALHRTLFREPSGLECLDMATLHISAEWLHPETGNVLFNFHGRGDWKRATIYSRIYGVAQSSREFLAVETTLRAGAAYEPETLFEAFRQHVEELGLAEGLHLEGHDFVENCYPLHSVGAQAKLDIALRRILDAGIIVAGRQGRFEYLPTSTGVIAQVHRHIDMQIPIAGSSELAA